MGWRYPQDDGGCIIQYYTIERDDGEGGPFTVLESSLSSSQFRYYIQSGLSVGKSYRVKVSATNNVGTSVGNLVSIIASNVPSTPTRGPYREIGESTSTSIRLKYDQIANTGGSNIISYHLQRTADDGTGFFDVIGGPKNYSLSTQYTVTGLTTAKTYRFRYRAINLVGSSAWSPISYLQPASVPSTPKIPEYISSSDDQILIQLFRSEDDGGLPIQDYELWIDEGSLESDFTKLSTYNFALYTFTFPVDRVANLLTKGLNYRFKFRSLNAIGYSDFSDSVRIALGPLPAKPLPVSRALLGNSPTSIGIHWTGLVGETLEVLEYRLYMDDGNGVLFNLIYKGIDVQFTK